MIAKIEGLLTSKGLTNMRDDTHKYYDTIDLDEFDEWCDIYLKNGEVVIDFSGLTIKVPKARVKISEGLL
jgi:hypothetical protein